MDAEKKLNSILFIVVIGIISAVEIITQKLPIAPLMQTGTARFIEIILVLIAIKCFNKNLSAIGLSSEQIAPGLRKGLIWSAGFGVIAAMLGAVLFISGINPFKLLNARLPDSISDIILFYLIGGLIAPVAEEIFFRGMIYGYIKSIMFKRLKHWSIPVALTISTYLFVAAHQTSSGIPLPQLVGGIVFCIAYELEKSLMTPIMIHSLGNIALFTISFL